MDIDAVIGDTVRKLRKRKKLSQEQFSELMKLSRGSIVNMEKGRQSFTTKNLFNACVILGVKPTTLFPAIPNSELSFDVKTRTKVVKRNYAKPILKIKP